MRNPRVFPLPVGARTWASWPFAITDQHLRKITVRVGTHQLDGRHGPWGFFMKVEELQASLTSLVQASVTSCPGIEGSL